MTTSASTREGTSRLKEREMPSKRLARGLASLGAAVDDDEAGARAAQVLGSRFGHGAGAHQGDDAAVEASEDLAGKLDGNTGHGNGAEADLGLGAHSLCDVESPIGGAAEQGADRSGLGGDVEGVLDLSKHLSLPHHQRIEGRCDSKQVSDSRPANVSKKVLGQHLGYVGACLSRKHAFDGLGGE